MKTKQILWFLPLTLLYSGTPAVNPSIKAAAKTFDGKAFNTKEVMDFDEDTEEEVKAYYDYDKMITHKGDDLKSYLYDVISKDYYAVSYDKAWDWYKITDRNWDLSREITPETYLFKEDTGNNHYEVMMYFEDEANQNPNKAINKDINGFTNDTTVTGVDWENKKKNSSYLQVDREHVWAKNHGFKRDDATKEDPVPNAGTDLHHLVAADHNTNSAGHNDDFYGEVKDHSASTTKEILAYYADGTTAVSGWRGLSAQGETVFEPTDEWKGDVARCLLYMATRYGKEENPNTKAEPYLSITDDVSVSDASTSDTLFHGIQHNLSTYLQWTKDDPVSSYEYKRNCLIYNNVQKNRNPFIDFPELSDWVFATTTSTSVDFVTPVNGKASDYSCFRKSYNTYKGQSYELAKHYASGSEITITASDPDAIEISSDKKSFKALKEGTYTITVEEETKGGEVYSRTTDITVKPLPVVNATTLSSYSVEAGAELTLALELPTVGYEGEKIEYVSSDTSVAEIQDGKVIGVAPGTCTIRIVITGGHQDIVLSSFELEVTMSRKMIYLMVIVVAAVLLIGILILIFSLVHKTNKKPNANYYVKKAYNNTKKKVTKSSSSKKRRK